VRLARADQGDGNGEPPFEVEDDDAKKLLALQGKLAAAALALSKHRRRLVEAKIDARHVPWRHAAGEARSTTANAAASA
jgi:hypothetical protein